jgi:hypothetical protein
MKCSQAVETMLDADSADLSPEGSSALALHLRSCAKCARVAATMRADVHVLAAVMPAAPVGTRTRWGLVPGVALASAAAVLLFVVMRERPVPAVRTQQHDATPVVVARPPVPLGVHADRRRRAPTTRASAPAFDGVSVSSNGSVTVLRTSNPKITVIWFN